MFDQPKHPNGDHSAGLGTPLTRNTDHSSLRLLFVVNEAGEYVELSRVAAAAKRHGHDVAFLFAPASYYRLSAHRASCRYQGFDAYFLGNKATHSERDDEIARQEARLQNGYLPLSLANSGVTCVMRSGRLRLTLVMLLIAPVLLLTRIFSVKAKSTPKSVSVPSFAYLRSLLYAREVYRALQPDLVIFGQEFPGSPNSLIAKDCTRDNIPTIIVPFAVGTTKEMVESLFDKPDHDADRGLLNRLSARLFPNWLNYYRGKRLLRLPGKSILLLEYLGLSPAHPWIPNQSCTVSCIAVESSEMLRYYQRMGFPDRQLQLTGAAYDDLLFSASQSVGATRERVRHGMNISIHKKLLVCAWPTDQFGSRHIPLEFDNYKSLCEAWASTLAKVAKNSEFEVVICPHPVTDKGFLVDVLRPYRLHHRISNLDTARMVACSDLFIACVSSTIRWAIALGIPVVNYDCYDYGYTDFDCGAGVVTTNVFADFAQNVQTLTEDAEAFDAARKAQTACAPEWGVHDGKSLYRILSLFEQLSSLSAKHKNAGHVSAQRISH